MADKERNRLGIVPTQTHDADMGSAAEGWLSKVAIDIGSAALAAFTVAPIVFILDSAVMTSAFGTQPIRAVLTSTTVGMLRRPHKTIRLRPFGAIWTLYAGTYTSSNVVDTTLVQKSLSTTHATSSNLTKFGIVSTVNMGLSLYKDNQLAKAFGPSAVRALPPASYIPFILRDGITIFATFSVPTLISPRLPDILDGTINRLSIAQLLVPAASQTLVTPLHLLGLDLHHRRTGISIADRLQAMFREWGSNCLARMARIVPGLAFGNVINTSLRSHMLEY